MIKIKELFKDIIKYKNNKITYLGIVVVIIYICSLIVKSYHDKDLKMFKLSLAIYIVILIGMCIVYFYGIFSYGWNQYKELKNLIYFNILEKNAKTDAKKRQELVSYINNLLLIQCKRPITRYIEIE